jgi:hypothetical protein
MKIEVQRREIKSVYLVVIGLDLIFLFMNTPWMSLPIPAEGQPVQLASLFDFVKYQLDLKIEQNVATWYSSVILLAAGMMALLNGWYRPAVGTFA